MLFTYIQCSLLICNDTGKRTPRDTPQMNERASETGKRKHLYLIRSPEVTERGMHRLDPRIARHCIRTHTSRRAKVLF